MVSVLVVLLLPHSQTPSPNPSNIHLRCREILLLCLFEAESVLGGRGKGIFGRFTVIKGFLVHLEDEPKNLCYGVNVSEQDGGDGGEAVLGRR